MSAQFTAPSAAVSASVAASAAATYAERRRRDAAFADVPGLFGEPAWDMLLDLYAAAADGRPASVARVCTAAAIAPTTALRCIANLVALGLVAHVPGTREAALALTDRGRALMGEALGPV